jgi:1-acyl-sn-glycerol-3-phosphate acyltransferase
MMVTTYLLAPSKIILTGHHYDLNAKSFTPIIANHQIYTDWWYFWLIAWFRSAHGEMKIIMKEDLKNLPIFGFGMQCFDFIFLARRWQIDRERLVSSMQQAKSDNAPMWLLLFPEGTTFDKNTHAKTLAYAKKMGWDGRVQLNR